MTSTIMEVSGAHFRSFFVQVVGHVGVVAHWNVQNIHHKFHDSVQKKIAEIFSLKTVVVIFGSILTKSLQMAVN